MDIPDVENLRQKIQGRPALSLLFMVICLPILVVPVLTMIPSQPAFHIQARTEVADVRVRGNQVPRWYVKDSTVMADERLLEGFEGQIEITSRARIRFVRGDDQGLEVQVRADGAAPVARIYDASEEPIAQARERLGLRLSAPSNGAMTLPITGSAVIGDVVHAQTHEAMPIMLEGRLMVLVRGFWGKDRFPAETADLQPGDRLSIEGSEREVGYGFVRLSDRPGFEFIYQALGRQARVDRFGSSGYVLQPNLWTRITVDPFVQTLSLFYLTLGPGIIFLLNASVRNARERAADRRRTRGSEELERASGSEERGRPERSPREEPVISRNTEPPAATPR